MEDIDSIFMPEKEPEWPVRLPEKFAAINRMVIRDLNEFKDPYRRSFFGRFRKEDIARFLRDPRRFQNELREAIVYIYGASPHFRRLIQYFVSLSDCSYIVSPYRVDPKKTNVKTTNINYRKVLNSLSVMNIRTQLPKILAVCLREDVCYLTMHITADSIIFQQLPSRWCRITCIENNVPNVTFNFHYFWLHPDYLDFYPEEFRRKYEEIYKKDPGRERWIELDAPTSFAVKANPDILTYALPPFAGILREVFDLDEYRQLKLNKTAIENYALLVEKIPIDEDGNYLINYDKAKAFWGNLDSVLPDEVGSVLTPLDIEKISFERTNTADRDTITEAEENLFTAAGVSSLLFNNSKAAASALLLSIKADQELTYGIVKGFEDAINRYIQYNNWGKYFKVTFLDVSPYNRKEAGDGYLKAASYGLPTISLYAASQGLGQAELDAMSFLETKVLGLQDMFKPIQSSATMSSDALQGTGTGDAGRPEKEMEELTEEGERTRDEA